MRLIWDSGGTLKERTANKVLAAVGRAPISADLGLEEAGVGIERGYVQVNEQMQTANTAIYAIGECERATAAGPRRLGRRDCRGRIHDGRTGEGAGCVSHPGLYLLSAAGGGSLELSEEQAQAQGYEVKVGRFPFRALGKALAAGHDEGMVKLGG